MKCSPWRVPSGAVSVSCSPGVPSASGVVAADLEPAVRTGQVERPARPPAVHRRQVPPPRRREAVEHRADELQQRRLAGLVRAVEHVQRVGELLDPQAAPNAVAVDFQVGDFHAWGSSPLSRSTPSTAASRSARSRAALPAKADRRGQRAGQMRLGHVLLQVRAARPGSSATGERPAESRRESSLARTIPAASVSASSDLQRHAPGGRRAIAVIAAEPLEQVGGQPSAPQAGPSSGPRPATVHEINSADGRRRLQQRVHPLAKPRFQVFARGRLVDQQSARSATARVGRDQAGSRVAAAHRLGRACSRGRRFLPAAALRAAAVVDHLRPAQRRAAVVRGRRGPNSGRARACSAAASASPWAHGDGVQAASDRRVKSAGRKGRCRVATDAQPAAPRVRSSRWTVTSSTRAARKDVDVLRQGYGSGPGLGRIDRAARPNRRRSRARQAGRTARPETAAPAARHWPDSECRPKAPRTPASSANAASKTCRAAV